MTETFDPYRKWLGIPPDEQPPDFYRLLGIPRFEGDPDVIENAAHRQMAYIRTFQSGRHAAESQKLLNELAAAKVCLLTAARKEQYDATLREQTPVEPPSLPAPESDSGEDSNSVLRFPSETNTVSNRRSRKPARSNTTLVLAPILSTLGAIVVIIIVVLVYTSRQRKSVPGPKRKEKDSATAAASDKPKASEDSSNSKTTTAEGKSNGAASAKEDNSDLVTGKGKSPQKSPPGTSTDATASDGPKAKPSLGEREQRILQQLETIREELSRRELNRSRNLLANSARTMRVGRAKEEAEQTQVLAQYLDEFWNHADRGLKKARDVLAPPPPKPKDVAKPAAEKPATGKPSDTAEKKPSDEPAKSNDIAKDSPPDAKPDAKPDVPPPPPESVEVALFQHKIVVEKISGDELTYRAGDSTKTARLRELPSLDAAALAFYSLKGDDLFGRVYVAAFLCVDTKGDRAENHRVAKLLFDELSKSASAPFPFLEREIQRALGPH